jgi:predicted ATPase/class 3 adenylate cyclase
MEVLESQRADLGDETVDPALFALEQQIAALEETPVGVDRGEDRRIVTVLFTDIVGSTAIASQLDPEDWRAVVGALHAMAGKKVQEYGGTVVQYLGDGLLALFGVNGSSERDPESAVCAALEIQIAVPTLDTDVPLQLRIGINTGLVVMGEFGSDARREFTASGDAMNLAARLQESAPPGGVLISQRTYRHVRGLFDMSPQPPLKTKGRVLPLQTYQVIKSKTRPYRIAARGVGGVKTATVGREMETRLLQAVFQSALKADQLIWAQLVGRPGVGKSRLVSDFSEMLEWQPEEASLLRTYALEGDSKQPYSLARRLWFDHFLIPDDTSSAETEAIWVKGVQSYLGDDSDEAAHVLGLLLGLPFQDSPHIGAMREEPRQLKWRAFEISRVLFDHIRASKLLVLVVEDLHWADPSSWDYLDQVLLSSGNGNFGAFCLATARPEWEPSEVLIAHPGHTRIDLQPLTEAASYLLAAELLQRVDRIPERVLTVIADRSEGVPYFAEEIVNWLIDQRILDQSVDPWRFAHAQFERSPLPATLQHLLQTRLSALGDELREALQNGSVFGRVFWEGGLQALGVDPNREAMNGLEVRGFLEAQPTTSFEGEREWRFHHNLMRDVVYESILKRHRPDLHRLAGNWLEEQARRTGRVDELAGQIGEHAERAGDKEAAADWYLRAGKRSKTQSALTEAREFFNRTLGLLPTDAQQLRWEALLERDDVLAAMGDTENRERGLNTIHHLAGELKEPAYLAEAYYRQAVLFEHTGDDQKALEVSEPALEAARASGNLSIEIRLLALVLVCQSRLGDLKGTSALAEEILTRSNELEEDFTLSRVLNNLGVYYAETGDIGSALELNQRQIEINHRIGERVGEAVGLSNVGYNYIQLGQFEKGLDPIERSLKLNEALGARRGRAYNLLNLGFCYWRGGDADSAQQTVEEGLNEFEDMGDAFGRGISHSYMALVLEYKGDFAGAARYFQAARERLSEAGIRGYEYDTVAGLARCALERGSKDEAQKYAVELWEYLSQSNAKGMEFPVWAYQTCAIVFDAIDDVEKSHTAIEAGYQDLMARAERISDEAWRNSFLEELPEHRGIVEMWNRKAEA